MLTVDDEYSPRVSGAQWVGRRSLRTRMVLIFLLMAAALGFFGGGSTSWLLVRNGRQRLRAQLNAVADFKEAQINDWIGRLQLDLSTELARENGRYHELLVTLLTGDATASEEGVLAQGELEAQLRARFAETVALRDSFTELFLLDRRGVVIFSTQEGRVGEMRGWAEYFRAGLQAPCVHVHTVSLSGVAADLNNVVAVHPIVDESGETLGVLAGLARLATLDDLVNVRVGLGESGETYLVGENHVLLTTPHYPGYQQGQMYISTPGVNAALDAHQRGLARYPSYHHGIVIGVYRWLPELNVALIAEQSQREALAPLSTTLVISIVITLVSVLLAVGTVLYITESVTRPVKMIAETAAAIADGDLEREVQVHRQDELGVLAQAFNHMTRQLRAMIRREEQRAGELEQEIAERQRAEAERARLLRRVQAQAHQMREQAYQVQQIIDTMPEGVLQLEAVHGGARLWRVVRANPLGRRDLESLAQAKVGDSIVALGDRPLRELLSPPPRGLWHELTVQERSYQLLARVIERVQGPDQWLVVLRDVTRQREMQHRIQQQERLAAVGQLAAGIAHDFNNIMAIIMLYAQIAARSPGLAEQVRERLQVINAQAEHASTLIQQILDFSRRGMLERRPLELLPLLKEQVKMLERIFPESIRIQLESPLGSYLVNADPTRMQQMVMNLALNARDAMPEGGELRFELDRVALAADDTLPLPDIPVGDWVRLQVTDTGVGISEEVMPRIFEPFFTTKGPGEGSGLGLPQVHGIVAVHDGLIDVASQPGEGTTFTIYLPALRVQARELQPAAPVSETLSLPSGERQTVLVVEDNAAAREALAASLDLLNYRVLLAANGLEALVMLAQHPGEVDAILSDVIMPEMGGLALYHTLREREVEIPMLMLTGHPLQTTLEETEGLAGWLSKPPSLKQLGDALREVMGGTNRNSD